MGIAEAVTKAMQEGKYIYRTSDVKENMKPLYVIPTNTWDCCIMILDSTDKVGKRWNPNANDLIADDWEVS